MFKAIWSPEGSVGFLLAVLIGGFFGFWLMREIKRSRHKFFLSLVISLLIGILLIAILPAAIKFAHMLHLSMGHFGYPFLDAYLWGILMIMIGTFIAAWVYPSKHETKLKPPSSHTD